MPKHALRILCAAIWYDNGSKHVHQPKNIEQGIVICGRRHHNVFAILKEIPGYMDNKRKCVQGFLTSDDRFVGREEAAQIAFQAKQINEELEILMSEDLY